MKMNQVMRAMVEVQCEDPLALLTSEDEHVEREDNGSENICSEPAPVIISIDVEVQDETAKDGTKWNPIDFGSNKTESLSVQLS